MGSSCCSKVKEPTEITILKPEKNIRSSNQNQNNSEQYNTNNFQIIDIEQNGNYQNTLSNISNQFDLNSYQNNTSPLTQKEIDDILNQAFPNSNSNYQEMNINLNDNNINNNINNNVTPPQYKNTDLNNLYQNQNNQNIPLEQEIEKYLSSQPKNENPKEKENNIDLNIEEILKKQSNQSKTDFDIEEIIKNTESKENNQKANNDLNLDIFFNQTGNQQISDDLINKLFESSDKRSDNNNPLFLSQQIQPRNLKNDLSNDNKYYSPGNSPQRSGVLKPVSSQLKQIYEIK